MYRSSGEGDWKDLGADLWRIRVEGEAAATGVLQYHGATVSWVVHA
jgi:hypothetical protein